MLRRTIRRAYEWKDKSWFSGDQKGRFNLEEAAAELNLEPNYVRALYKPRHYTFGVRGQRYPAEVGRSNRPGGASSSMGKMFPLYRRDKALEKKLRHVPRSQYSTF